KNYYYPDLPKGYQITQITKPVGIDGYLEIDVNDELKKVLIHDIHLEEDTASLDHYDSYSLLNYNRSGIPLIETVTEPCMHSKEEALVFLETLRSLILYCGVSEARSDKGQMRCDVNVSISDTQKLGEKVEIKNINSFYNVGLAIDYEIERQTELLEKGEQIIQETRRFDDSSLTTIRMRTKVDAVDYKYFIEPNIVPTIVTSDFLGEIKKEIPMLQLERVTKYIQEYELSKYDSVILAKTKEISDFFNECVKLGCDPKSACNWINGMLLSYLNTKEITLNEVLIKPSMIKALIDLIDNKTISSKQAKEVFTKMIETGKEPNVIVKEEKMVQITDDSAIMDIIIEVLKENESQVKEYTPEKGRMVDFFVGQVMKKSHGKANPSKTMEMLKEELLKYNK
ncbi:MAG: Asp-tRNA(Asn)/Glu-tRNA(Gln) amidotransferase subunit GatB, partial [Bacilli bacterium]